MTSPVEVEVAQLNGVPVLRLRGEMRLDVADVERALNRLAAGRPAVVVLDLSRLSFISSLGMGLLNTFRRGLHSHGGVTKIAGAQPNVATALRLCSLDKLFEMHETIESAIPQVSPA
jgi:anti-sigma B factor antagonist